MPEQPRHSIVAIVACNDIEASTSFYVRLSLSMRTDHGGYRILSDGRGWLLHLSAEAPEGWIVRGRNPNGLYLYLKDVDGLASRVADLTGGVRPEHKPWGMYEFSYPTLTGPWCGSVGQATSAHGHASRLRERALRVHLSHDHRRR